ncbi:glycosyltransferase family 4 protein (plasmid) [Peteryoungia desertarenae]|uniref:Glycosyltransferase family 4 protein n=1 Tax=Peteryoungia desertarenae TaxID=1813451 RepID=A0ABX6QTT9_9HYPH|nr:glycosyltransferase family 1 protein [Peteryoungia desertarenae]QLF71701.1 glycosyltransferase family 4 protein [Peteryoungia desertarenae]
MRIGVDARNLVSSISGIGRYVLEMCRALEARGHSLVLYLPERSQFPLPDLLDCELRIENFKGPWRRAIWSMTALPKAVRRDQLDLFWGPAHRLPLGLPPRLPTVVTIHDLVWLKAPETMRWQTWLGERAFMAASLKRAQHIIADSKATADDIVSFLPAADGRVQVVYPGLTNLPPPGGRELVPTDRQGQKQPYALFVGTLEPRKNLARLLEAFASIHSSNLAGLKLVIAGGQGWRMGDLSTLIAHLGIHDRTILTGYVSDAELAQLYSSAEFLLMPSLYEGFGFPIIEAQSFGVPVITSSVSSMPEVAGDGAMLVNPLSTKEIAEAIKRLSSELTLKSELSSRALANARRFSWPKASKELIGYINS